MHLVGCKTPQQTLYGHLRRAWLAKLGQLNALVVAAGGTTSSVGTRAKTNSDQPCRSFHFFWLGVCTPSRRLNSVAQLTAMHLWVGKPFCELILEAKPELRPRSETLANRITDFIWGKLVSLNIS